MGLDCDRRKDLAGASGPDSGPAGEHHHGAHGSAGVTKRGFREGKSAIRTRPTIGILLLYRVLAKINPELWGSLTPSELVSRNWDKLLGINVASLFQL